MFTASETLFMVSMALCYFYSWQTYSVEMTSEQQQSYSKGILHKDLIVAVHILEVIEATAGSIGNSLSILSRSSACQRVGQLFEPLVQRFQLFMIRRGNGPETKGYSQLGKEKQFGESQLNTYSEIEVKDISKNADQVNCKISSGISSKSNSPPRPDNMLDNNDYNQRISTDTDEEKTINFFGDHAFGGGFSRNNGAMTPIDELS